MATKALKQFTVSYNGTDISAYLNKASQEATVEAIDTTNLASDAREQTPGGTSWSVPVGGMWAKALDDVLGVDAAEPPATLRTLVVVIGPTAAKVTNTWTGSTTVGAFVSDYKVDASDPMGMITWSATLTVSGAPVRT